MVVGGSILHMLYNISSLYTQYISKVVWPSHETWQNNLGEQFRCTGMQKIIQLPQPIFFLFVMISTECAFLSRAIFSILFCFILLFH